MLPYEMFFVWAEEEFFAQTKALDKSPVAHYNISYIYFKELFS